MNIRTNDKGRRLLLNLQKEKCARVLRLMWQARSWAAQQGFSLVELMVVVSIIGILAAVALPQYGKYQGKARQAEAQADLSGMFMAETTYSSDLGSYTICLRDIGFNPQPQFYGAGFPTGTSTPNPSPTGTGATCGSGTGQSYFPATKSVGGSAPSTGATSAITPSTFTAGASGYPFGATVDDWTINEAHVLTHVTFGGM